MKRLLLALGLCLALSSSALSQGTIVGPGNMVLCPQSANNLAASATTTQLVAGVANQRIYVCGWHVTSILSTSSTFQLVYGTGASCTSPTNLTPTFNVTSTAPSADHQSYAIGPNSATGQSVCMITGTGATGTAILLYYSQF